MQGTHGIIKAVLGEVAFKGMDGPEEVEHESPDIQLIIIQAKAVLQRFVKIVYQLDQLPLLVTYTSLFAHLLDQFNWQLLSAEPVEQAGNELLELAVQVCHTDRVSIIGRNAAGYLAAWQTMLVAALRQKLHG